jgi:hypothetical protein
MAVYAEHFSSLYLFTVVDENNAEPGGLTNELVLDESMKLLQISNLSLMQIDELFAEICFLNFV